MSPISRLRIAALPFVTRSLRRGSGKRLWVFALVLALATSMLGTWLALGSGELERGIREDLKLEPRRQDREHREFVVIVNDDATWQRAQRDRETMLERGRESGSNTAMYDRALQGRGVLRQAVTMYAPEALSLEHRELRARAEALLGGAATLQKPIGRARMFDWNDDREVALLERIVEQRGIPSLERYASPLGLGAAIDLVGWLACAALMVLVIVVGPVLTGIAVAQESHENTLQPVAGTALSARQIAIGLVAGALAPVAIVASPQLVLAIGAGLVAGNALALAAFFALLVPCAWAVTMLALVVGLFAGRRRGTGAIGITLLGGVALWLFAGIPLGFDWIGHSDAAMITLLPSGGLVYCAREAFLWRAGGVDDGGLVWRLGAAAIASLVVGALALRAAERRVPGRFVAPLRRNEVLVGSAVLSALTLAAFSEIGGPGIAFGALAVMVMPMQVLLMARVPAGDAPSGAGNVRLGALLREFAVFVAVHGVLAAVVLGPEFLGKAAQPGLLHLLWALAIAPLVAIRIVAAPPRLPASVWAGFAFVLGIVEYVSGVAQLLDGSRTKPFFPLWQVSPLLGLLHIALLVVVPWTLVLGIRRAGVRAASSGD